MQRSANQLQAEHSGFGKSIPRPNGRPPMLLEEEDDALVAYVVWMQRGGFPARP